MANGKGHLMEASSGRSRTRLLVIDFLATLFVTFCIGVVTALVLAACVMLMTGDAHGAADARPGPPPAPAPASTSDLMLAHYFAARYAGLIAVDRFYPGAAPAGAKGGGG
jgi:hypothetical protein